MAGIYIHIPFCKKACHYCDFHFSTSLTYKNELVENLLNEIDIRKDYLQNEIIDTIYLGGGTPSLLSEKELNLLLEKIHQHFHINPLIECTLEANPDDLSKEKIASLKQSGINRLSIGIQSFFNDDLIYMNRSHDTTQATRCIEIVRNGGIENFSIDLIFGYPLLTDEKWKQNIETALQWSIPHLSCYAMTIEPKTALASFIKTKKTPPINHEQSATQFEYLMKTLQANGYDHYEISNYAIEGKRAVHNSNYWNGVSYMGIGPSAHSFNGQSRQWNVSNNKKYIEAISNGIIPFEQEILSDVQRINERIMTSLRTMEGISSHEIYSQMSIEQIDEFNINKQSLLQEDLLLADQDSIRLSQKGKLFADYVAGELFI